MVIENLTMENNIIKKNMEQPKTQTYEDFAIEMVDSYYDFVDYDDAQSLAIIECERLILYAEDTDYFKEVLKFLNQM